jgi:hypothetical protein
VAQWRARRNRVITSTSPNAPDIPYPYKFLHVLMNCTLLCSPK